MGFSVSNRHIHNVRMGHIISIKGPIYCAQTGLETYFYHGNAAYRSSSAHLETQSPVYLRPLQPAVTIQLGGMRPIADTLL